MFALHKDYSRIAEQAPLNLLSSPKGLAIQFADTKSRFNDFGTQQRGETVPSRALRQERPNIRAFTQTPLPRWINVGSSAGTVDFV